MSIKLLHGDCRQVLDMLPECSVQCCVSSPPYWGLRSYLPEDHPSKHLEIGSEPTVDEWVATMVDVFRRVRRVLRDDGVLFLNLGDSYHGSGRGPECPGSTLNGRQTNHSHQAFTAAQRNASAAAGRGKNVSGLKPKDLIGQPWLVAKALQAPYYTGKIRHERDRVWLAAMIDGEGCFFIHKRKAGTRSYSKFTRKDGSEKDYVRTADTYGVGLEICNTHKAIIDRVQAICGGTVTTQGTAQNARRKQTLYRWRVAPNEAKRIAQEVYPHLVGKQHQARLLFSCPSTGNEGALAHQAMMDLHNGVPTSVDFSEPPTLFEPGWYLRQDIVWGKSNPMPESARDRCTKAHEYIFLLSKSANYFWNFDAVQEPVNGGAHARRPMEYSGAKRPGFGHGYDAKPKGRYRTEDGWGNERTPAGWATGTDRRHEELQGNFTAARAAVGRRKGPPGNPAERAAAPKETGNALDSAYADGKGARLGRGAGWRERKLAEDRDAKNNASMDDALADQRDKRNPRSVWTFQTEPFKGAHFATFPQELARRCITAGTREGDTVLDPFGGSGTVGLVADGMQRHAILIDIDERNLPMARDRIAGDAPLFAEVTTA